MGRTRGEALPGRGVRVPPRTWAHISPVLSTEIRDLLLRVGAAADPRLAGPGEAWRVRLGGAVFTGYATGTIYCTGGLEPELGFIYQRITGKIESRG